MKIFRVPLVIVLVVVAGRILPANALTVTETVLHSFTATPDGFNPVAGLVQGSDSNFYGTTRGGGTFNSGTVFRVNSDGTYTNLYSFGGSPDGATPLDGLVQGSDSNFYGTTFGGGTGTHDAPSGGAGTVFRISPSGNYTSLYSFASYQDDAGLPYGGLVQGTNGNFYGTTGSGGSNACHCGTVFQITPEGVETILYSFAGPPNDGNNPQAGLVLGSDGNFYGTTYFGGSSTNCGEPGCGTVFRISPDGVYSNLYSLGGYPVDGTGPRAALVEGIDGNFYGTTWIGGSSGHCEFGCGTVFQITPEGIEADLHSFDETDGANLAGALVQGSDSNFYGTTYGGGPGYGNVFRITPTGVFSNIYTIPYVVGSGSVDGISPEAGLVLGSDGDFYGTTAGGGTSTNCGAGGCGTVFKLAISNSGGGGGGGSCTYTLSAASITLTAKGGSKNVSVKVKGTDCAWTAVSNDPFITITSGSSGTGNGKVDYTVPGNTNTTALVGTLTIAGESVTVTQAPGGCTFRLSPKNTKLLAKGGAKTVRVTPNLSDCAWTAVSNSGFITITSGSTNIIGKGTVSYTVATNATSMILTGSMTIAGQPYTVIQAGAK